AKPAASPVPSMRSVKGTHVEPRGPNADRSGWDLNRGRSSDDARDVVGRKELSNRNRSLNRAPETIDVSLVADKCAEELKHLGRRRTQCGELTAQLEEGHCRFVAPLLVAGECFIE